MIMKFGAETVAPAEPSPIGKIVLLLGRCECLADAVAHGPVWVTDFFMVLFVRHVCSSTVG